LQWPQGYCKEALRIKFFVIKPAYPNGWAGLTEWRLVITLRFVVLKNFSDKLAFTTFFAAITLGFARRQAGWRGVGDFKLP
jgi:hypothetical protein